MDSASLAVQLCIGFIGIWALWLTDEGSRKVWFYKGVLGKVLSPITSLLFPQVPKDHPAMGAMVMNMAANMMGLGNGQRFGTYSNEGIAEAKPP